jgi:hypothetical protein
MVGVDGVEMAYESRMIGGDYATGRAHAPAAGFAAMTWPSSIGTYGCIAVVRNLPVWLMQIRRAKTFEH